MPASARAPRTVAASAMSAAGARRRAASARRSAVSRSMRSRGARRHRRRRRARPASAVDPRALGGEDCWRPASAMAAAGRRGDGALRKSERPTRAREPDCGRRRAAVLAAGDAGASRPRMSSTPPRGAEVGGRRRRRTAGAANSVHRRRLAGRRCSAPSRSSASSCSPLLVAASRRATRRGALRAPHVGAAQRPAHRARPSRRRSTRHAVLARATGRRPRVLLATSTASSAQRSRRPRCAATGCGTPRPRS